MLIKVLDLIVVIADLLTRRALPGVLVETCLAGLLLPKAACPELLITWPTPEHAHVHYMSVSPPTLPLYLACVPPSHIVSRLDSLLSMSGLGAPSLILQCCGHLMLPPQCWPEAPPFGGLLAWENVAKWMCSIPCATAPCPSDYHGMEMRASVVWALMTVCPSPKLGLAHQQDGAQPKLVCVVPTCSQPYVLGAAPPYVSCLTSSGRAVQIVCPVFCSILVR